MGVAQNIVGEKFGRLSIIRTISGYRDMRVLCRCDCGTEKVMSPYPIVRGIVVSCGCNKEEKAAVLCRARAAAIKTGCRCGETNPANFYKRNRTVCKACLRKRFKQYGVDHRNDRKKYAQQQYLQNRDNIRKRTIAYYYANKDEVIRKRKESYQRRHAQLIQHRHTTYDPARAKKWHITALAKDPEKYRLIKKQDSARRKAAKLGALSEKVDYAEIIKRDGMKCHICLKTVKRDDLSFDHLVPLSKGGAHAANNIAVSHLLCNISRGAGRIPAQLLLMS